MENNWRNRHKAFAIFTILFCLYLLVFNGVTSTDDEQLYISLTESMAAGRGYSALALLGNDRLQGSTGSVEPLHPLLGVPLYLLSAFFGTGKAQTLFLLPSLYSASSATLIYLIIQERGYEEKTAVFTAVAFGAGTIALPYARMNFREPLAAFALIFAVYMQELSINKDRRTRERVLWAGLFILALGFAVLTKITTVMVVPVLFIEFILRNKSAIAAFVKINYKWKALAWIGIAVGIIVTLGSLLPSASLSRFTLRFADYIRYTLPRLPHDHFWQASAGLLFSPGKGLFVYSPILIVMFLNPWVARRKTWMVGVAALIFLTVTQAYIYNDEWWGITWGTRALLPVLPLIILSTVPAIDYLLRQKNRGCKRFAFSLLGLSILIQTGRLFTADPVYVNWATQTAGRSIDAAMQWDFSLAPFFRHFWLGLQDHYSDIAWLNLNRVNGIALIIFIVSLILLLISSYWILIEKRLVKRFFLFSSVFLVIGTAALIISIRDDDRYYTGIPDIGKTRNVICNLAAEDDLILVDYYLHPFWWYYSNFGCEQPSWAGLPYIHRTAIHAELFYPRLPETIQLIEDWLPTGDVYLVTTMPNDNPSYDHSLIERGFNLWLVDSTDTAPFNVFLIKNENENIRTP